MRDLFDALPSRRYDVPHQVEKLFFKLTLDLIDRGFTHYSARAVIHRIRWHFHVEKGQRDFKCNNNWTPQLARDFHEAYPQYDGFFETRRSPGTVPIANDEVITRKMTA